VFRKNMKRNIFSLETFLIFLDNAKGSSLKLIKMISFAPKQEWGMWQGSLQIQISR
jgi:hypothetical protein